MTHTKETDARSVHPDALKNMKASLHNLETTRWAAYENHALDSSNLGDMRFLAVGPENTFKMPPTRYPDSHTGTGWAYQFIGWVDLSSGTVTEVYRVRNIRNGDEIRIRDIDGNHTIITVSEVEVLDDSPDPPVHIVDKQGNEFSCFASEVS
jgi:hypothetical protein